MSDGPATPLPPPDLDARQLPLRTLGTSDTILRLHGTGLDPRFFGPADGLPPAGRFDAPDGAYRVCYAGLSVEACFAEKLCRTDLRVLSLARCAALSVSGLAPTRPLRLVELHGAGLAALGATADVAHGRYRIARRWGRALWAHPETPDGIVWRSRLDDDHLSVALFDRCAADLDVRTTEPLLADARRFEELVERYRMAVIPDR